ncbi:MAG: HNH endonuclease [Actinobacteria bacterium]|nr:HNH endonuclease [Actinomycetota bacterium]
MIPNDAATYLPTNLPTRKHSPKTRVRSRRKVNPASTAFLRSYAWRKLRLTILLREGRRCGACGARPNSSNSVRLNVDHILPRKTHPELALDPDNLQVLCEDCNHGKGNWNATDFRSPHTAPAIGLTFKEPN